MLARRFTLLACLAVMLVPLAAADDGSGTPPTGDQGQCRSVSVEGPSSEPVLNWVVVDPDGCFSNIARRIVAYIISYIPPVG
jgi:hypothetical protein